MRYSELMASDPDAIDAAFFGELRKLQRSEIVELGPLLVHWYHTFFGSEILSVVLAGRPIINTGRVGTIYGAHRRP